MSPYLKRLTYRRPPPHLVADPFHWLRITMSSQAHISSSDPSIFVKAGACSFLWLWQAQWHKSLDSSYVCLFLSHSAPPKVLLDPPFRSSISRHHHRSPCFLGDPFSLCASCGDCQVACFGACMRSGSLESQTSGRYHRLHIKPPICFPHLPNYTPYCVSG